MSQKLPVCVNLVAALALMGTSSQASSAADETKSPRSAPRKSAIDRFSHVIAVETPYYTTGPQQGRPPDGNFPAGTRVTMIRKAGSYTLVRSPDGVRAYVTTSALKAIGTTPMNLMAVSGVVEGGNRFAFDLYERLRNNEGNLFFSPASISTALAMTYAGAAGNTDADMAKALHFDVPKDQIHEQMRVLLASWKTTDKKQGFRLDVANRLWGQDGYKFLPDFLRVTRMDYGAELARLDFAKEAEKARQTINQWVEEHTQDKIRNLIPSADTVREARLVLTNAVYFKGDWSAPFNKNLTKDEGFQVSANQKIRAPLMHKQHRFRYAAVDGLQLLELPYGDESLSMVVLLPEKVEGLGELEVKLTIANLQKWMASVKSEDVIVVLPKFKATTEFQLGDTLRAMGMATAFDPSTADFSEMTGGKDLFISAVIHKAFVDVNEEGTEAAAATGVVMVPTSARIDVQKPPVFRADHPFVFLIRDNRNGAILFLGRMIDPTK